MKTHTLSRVLLAFGITGLLATGCSGTSQEDMGTARLRLITPQAFTGELTQVSITTDTGFSSNLTPEANGDFTGSMTLPAGIHTFTGKAFIDADQVGESSPVSGEILAGSVTSVMIQILDTTGGVQPDFGPILESLTHPESTQAGIEVMLAVSIIDPDGEPVTLAWSDDCADSTFTNSATATTNWSKATPGACRVTVTGTSGGKSVSDSFDIVVFDPNANTGAADVNTVFISAPTIDMQVSLSGTGCSLSSSSSNATCPGSIASPDSGFVNAFANWHNGTPGTVSVFDDCGGTFSVFSEPQGGEFLDAQWLPPTTGGICRITVEATNGEGVTARLATAVLVRDGTAPPPPAPFIQMQLFNPTQGCLRTSDDTQQNPCPALSIGEDINIDGSVDWRGEPPGSFTLTDNCGGNFLTNDSDPATGTFSAVWQPPPQPGLQCTIAAVAVSVNGESSTAAGIFDIQ